MGKASSRTRVALRAATLSPQHRQLFEQLAHAGAVRLEDALGAPHRLTDAAPLLIRAWAAGGRCEVFYLFCRIHSDPLLEAVDDVLRSEGLPLLADELVAEVLARYEEELTGARIDERSLPVERLPDLVDLVLEDAVADLEAYLPGIGLRPSWRTRLCQGSSDLVCALPIPTGEPQLSRAELEGLTARALLQMDPEDRRLLLESAPAAPPSATRESRMASVRSRLLDEVVVLLRWAGLLAEGAPPPSSSSVLEPS